ncbi:Pentatricopeptide repeat-containing protein [Rhynchospora pubera]|uniref:Pentatricopeptide repeat-containing protein n=1 Tax=Rhynchospora pubera TaxID=906938 RepID=A0AAV8GEB2_9POAL|nr:Pentatricopeptide repeat-containing protein [Rhynchospora pubera]KAJ4801228.1 Pentatricopeptide repeat-containing protein [Rhynchospora pubera]
MAVSTYNRRHLSRLFKSCASISHLTQLHSLLYKSGLLHHPLYLRSLLSLSSLPPWRNLSYSLSLLLSSLSQPKSNSLPYLSLSLPLFRAFSSSIHPSYSLSLFTLLHCKYNSFSGFSPFPFPFLFKSCGRAFSLSDPPYTPFIQSGLHLHCHVIILGYVNDYYIQNSLISMYSVLSDIDSACKVFDEMTVKTTASWNSLMSAYDKIGDAKSAERLFSQMPERNITSWNSLINRFVKAGNLRGARRVFDEMPERDAISWNSLIAGYAQAKKYKSALGLFHEMQRIQLEPTQLTIILVLNACAEIGELMLGKRIHSYLNSKNILIDGYIGTALLDMYAKCGCLELARKLFDGMPIKHITCWNAMIVGLAVHGCSDEALELFGTIEKEKKQLPNQTTFLGVLIACRNKGLIQEGKRIFNRMIDEYKITPGIKHYGCMIDFLSRCGLVKEAYNMAKEMPIKANTVLWKTILSACRVHGQVELADSVFKELLEAGPLGEEEFVTMSNVYAEAERWQDVERLRESMVDCGSLKIAGWSQIDSFG